MTPTAIRLAVNGVALRLGDRLLASAFVVTGAALVYLVLFDQGAAAEAILGAAAAQQNTFHELFHDGRHLASAPCH